MSKIPRTLCPFCNLACQLGFELKDDQVRRVAYVTDSLNQGRLCPKGNAAAALINHRKRLYHATVDGKQASITAAIDSLEAKLVEIKPEELLAVYDASLTGEELEALAGWAQARGLKNLAYAAGPESAFLYGETPPFSLEDISQVEFALIAGDAFTQSSIISGYINDAKKDTRNFRYIVIDSVATNTSNFAHRFVRVKPGYEGLFLYGLWKVVAGKKIDTTALADVAGIDNGEFEAVAAMIRNKKGLSVYAPTQGASFDPFLAHGSLKELAGVLDDMVYLPLGKRVPAGVGSPFFSFMPQIMAGRIKAIVSFAAYFPWNYTQLRPMLRKVDFIAASSMFIPEGRFEFNVVLPLAGELEKQGSIRTAFGTDNLIKSVPGITGTLTAGEYIARFEGKTEPASLAAHHSGFDEVSLDNRAGELIKLKHKPRKGMQHLVIGSEPAIGFAEVFQTEDWIKINPKDVKQLGVEEGEEVGVETEQGDIGLLAMSSSAIPPGIAVVSTNHKPSAGLFELATDSSLEEGWLKPTWSRIWKR